MTSRLYAINVMMPEKINKIRRNLSTHHRGLAVTPLNAFYDEWVAHVHFILDMWGTEAHASVFDWSRKTVKCTFVKSAIAPTIRKSAIVCFLPFSGGGGGSVIGGTAVKYVILSLAMLFGGFRYFDNSDDAYCVWVRWSMGARGSACRLHTYGLWNS